jgi:general stress protein 26
MVRRLSKAEAHAFLAEGTRTGKALRREGRAAVCVDVQEPPFAYVIVAGEVEISEDRDEMLPWAISIAERYEGPERAKEFGRQNAVEGDIDD